MVVHAKKYVLISYMSPKQKKTGGQADKPTALEMALQLVIDVKADNNRLLKEREEFVVKLNDMRSQMSRMQNEMMQRIERDFPEDTRQQRSKKSGLLQYMKAGFGGMLGVISALLLVDIVSSVFSNDTNTGVDVGADADVGADVDADTDVGRDVDEGESGLFEDMFGGRSKCKKVESSKMKGKPVITRKSNESEKKKVSFQKR